METEKRLKKEVATLKGRVTKLKKELEAAKDKISEFQDIADNFKDKYRDELDYSLILNERISKLRGRNLWQRIINKDFEKKI
jgi:predicted RNase H-like nuclease (RuvC/YqgF family)